MLFKKFFTPKDFSHYVEKGQKLFKEDRYADARHAFLEALEKVDSSAQGSADRDDIMLMISDTGNRLGALNLSEAEHAVGLGDHAKAIEHLQLVLELSRETGLREKAEHLLISLNSPETEVRTEESSHSSHHCSGCGTGTNAAPAEGQLSPDHLSPQERFELLVQPLPGDLPRRYLEMGEKFAAGFLLLHEDEEKAGAAIFEDLAKENENNDILLYELAVINYKNGRSGQSENLFRRAIEINDGNALSYLGLVQLLVDTGRPAEAIPFLNHMIESDLLLEQAMIMLGDLKQMMGSVEECMEIYSKALTHPGAAKAAAERLVMLLQKQGRKEEATYLAKTYLKGCC